MNRFNLTDKRKAKALKMLRQGYTIRSIALDFDVHEDMLGRKLNELGIDHKAVRAQGIHTLRSMAYVEASEGDFKMKMQYLDKYDNEVDEPAVQDDHKSKTEIRDSIVKIINGQQ